MSRKSAKNFLAFALLFSADQRCQIKVEFSKEQVTQTLDGETDHVEVIALKSVDKKGGKSLHRIAARLVVGLIGGDVEIHILGGEGREAHARNLAGNGYVLGGQTGNAADYLMGLALKKLQHMKGVLTVAGLS